MSLPLTLFFLFALLSVVGAYLAVANWRGQRAGALAAVAAVLFYTVLLTGLFLLLRSGGYF